MAKETMFTRVLMLKSHLRLAQTEFCQEAKISSATYHKICKGDPKVQIRTFRNICKNLGANIDWVVDGTGEMFLKPETIDSTSWKDAAFAELQKTNAYLQQKFDEAQAMIAALIQRVPLGGKHEALIGTGLSFNEGESMRAAA